MIQTSVIIPARRERWLDKTIYEVQNKFGGTFEIIVTLDGPHKSKLPQNVTYYRNKESKGMRTSINQAVALAKGKYLMKLDAHCMVDKEIDLKLIKEHKPKWVQIPRRKRLNPHSWQVITDQGPDIDYMYIYKPRFIGVKNGKMNRDPKFKKILIDDTDAFQGSCYFMERALFNKLGLLDDKNFAGSGNEAIEVAFKVRHNGGRVIRNKKTWYAHARVNRYYATDRTKSREYIKVLAKKYGY